MSNDPGFHIGLVEGLNRFNSARTKAFLQEMFSHLRGKPAELLSFDEIKHRLRLREESYMGLQDVPIDKIAGSVGRYREFTRNFLPKRSISKDRWSRVYARAAGQAGHDPIELYKVGDVYFVRDGNHRVSVAKQMGVKSIEAHVTELPTSINIHPGMSEADIDKAAAYAAFLEETGLIRNRVHHQPMELSEASRYSDLLGHIYLHKAILEQMAQREVDLQEAAIHWYDTVYRPAITLIRKYNMQDILDVRTEADLYLWLVDHLRELRAEFGEESPSTSISDALVDFLQERHIAIPQELLSEKDDSLIISQTQMMRAISKLEKHTPNGSDYEA